MPQHIIKQPNGKFAIFSTVSDVFLAIDLTGDEMVKEMGRRAKRRAEEDTREIVESLNAGEKRMMFKSFSEAASEYREQEQVALDPEFAKTVKKVLNRLKKKKKK